LSYFPRANDARAGIMAFGLADAAEIPKIAEPLLAKLNATLTIQPVLTMEHLQRGIGAAPG
jgi:hypothetical protein